MLPLTTTIGSILNSLGANITIIIKTRINKIILEIMLISLFKKAPLYQKISFVTHKTAVAAYRLNIKLYRHITMCVTRMIEPIDNTLHDIGGCIA
jgi:hypothetical protein